MISATVAPFGPRISSRILAPLLSARDAFSAFATFFAGFLAAGLAALALFLALGVLFFLRGGLGRRNGCALFRNSDGLSVVVASMFGMRFILSAVDPRMTIHHSGASERQGNCRRKRDHSGAGEHVAMPFSGKSDLLDVLRPPR
jgi:hypothetical protein